MSKIQPRKSGRGGGLGRERATALIIPGYLFVFGTERGGGGNPKERPGRISASATNDAQYGRARVITGVVRFAISRTPSGPLRPNDAQFVPKLGARNDRFMSRGLTRVFNLAGDKTTRRRRSQTVRGYELYTKSSFRRPSCRVRVRVGRRTKTRFSFFSIFFVKRKSIRFPARR